MANDSSNHDAAAPVWQRIALGKSPTRTLIRAGLIALVLWLVFNYALIPKRVHQVSMSPTFGEDALILVNRWAYTNSKPGRGDIVGIRTTGDSIIYVKRVVGLPGEKIAIKDGTVYTDGTPLEEPYLVSKPASWDFAPRNLGQNEYFVIGDNRSMPRDDHYFGSVNRREILGTVIRVTRGKTEISRD